MKRLSILVFFLFALALPSPAQLWQSLGGGTSHGVRTLWADSSTNRLYLGGMFEYAGDSLCDGIAFWDGQTFHPLGIGVRDTLNNTSQAFWGNIASVIGFEGQILVGGFFQRIGGNDSLKWVAAFDGNAWDHMGCCFDAARWFRVSNGQLFSLGFESSASRGILVWNGAAWEPFGSDILTDGYSNAFCISYYKGEYYVGGNFYEGNGLRDIMRWNGAEWLPLGAGIFGSMSDLADLQVYKGILFVGGRFTRADGNVDDHLMAWDGVQWYDPFPHMQFADAIRDLDVIDDVLYISGKHYTYTPTSTHGPYGLAKYDGNQFCSFGGENLFAYDVEGLEGELYVTFLRTTLSNFTGDTVNYIARWLGGDSTDICISQPVRVTDPVLPGLGITLHPNPAQNSFALTLPQGIPSCRYKVHDITGREVLPEASYHVGGQAVEIGNLVAGLYFVEVMARGRTQVIKMIKR